MNCMEYFESFDHLSQVQTNAFYAFPSKSCHSSKKTLSKVAGNEKKAAQKISLKRLSSSGSQNQNCLMPNSLHLSVKQRFSTKTDTVNQLPAPIHNKQNINKRHYKTHNHSYSNFNVTAINSGFSGKSSSKGLQKVSFKPDARFQHWIEDSANQKMKNLKGLHSKKMSDSKISEIGRLFEKGKYGFYRNEVGFDEKSKAHLVFDSTKIQIKQIPKNRQKDQLKLAPNIQDALQSHQLPTNFEPSFMQTGTFPNNLTSQSYTSSSNFLKPEAPKNSRITRPSLALSLQEVAYIKTQSVGCSQENLEEDEFSVILGSLGSFRKNIKRVSSTHIVGESKVFGIKNWKGVTERRIKEKKGENISMKVVSEC